MGDLYDYFENLLDGVLIVFFAVVVVIISIILLLTLPVWIIPYIVTKYFRDKEERDNEDC